MYKQEIANELHKPLRKNYTKLFNVHDKNDS